MSIAASSGDRPRPDRSHRILSLAEARSGVPEPATDTITITFADAASHLQTCFFYPPRSSDFAPQRLGGSPAPPAVPCPSPRLSSLRRQPRLPPRSSRHAARATALRPHPSARREPRAGLWFLGCWLQYLSASAVFQPPSSPLSLLFFIFAPYYIYRQLPL